MGAVPARQKAHATEWLSLPHWRPSKGTRGGLECAHPDGLALDTLCTEEAALVGIADSTARAYRHHTET